jgi:hypothetical protein
MFVPGSVLASSEGEIETINGQSVDLLPKKVLASSEGEVEINGQSANLLPKKELNPSKDGIKTIDEQSTSLPTKTSINESSTNSLTETNINDLSITFDNDGGAPISLLTGKRLGSTGIETIGNNLPSISDQLDTFPPMRLNSEHGEYGYPDLLVASEDLKNFVTSYETSLNRKINIVFKCENAWICKIELSSDNFHNIPRLGIIYLLQKQDSALQMC